MIAIGAAFPSGETQPEIQSELSPEAKADELKNALLEADGNPQGDSAQSEAERQKRFIFWSPWYYPYAYPATYVVAAPAVTKVVAAPATTVVAAESGNK